MQKIIDPAEKIFCPFCGAELEWEWDENFTEKSGHKDFGKVAGEVGFCPAGLAETYASNNSPVKKCESSQHSGAFHIFTGKDGKKSKLFTDFPDYDRFDRLIEWRI